MYFLMRLKKFVANNKKFLGITRISGLRLMLLSCAWMRFDNFLG